MALTLKIISYQSQVLGSDAQREFGGSGGSIGRGQGNDWVLPDPERYISTKHFTLACVGQSWSLTDTSTNGVFLNQSEQPVGRGNSVPLNEGDHLKFGDYEVVVSITSELAASEPFDMQPETGAVSGEDPFAATAGTTGGLMGHEEIPEDITDDSFDLFADAEPGPARGGFGAQAAEPDHVPSEMASFQPPGAQAEQLPDDWDRTDYASASTAGPGAAAAPGDKQLPDDWDMTDFGGGAATPSAPAPPPGPAPEVVPGPAVAQPPAERLERPAAVPPRAAAAQPEQQERPQTPTPRPVAPAPDRSAVIAAFLQGAGLDPHSVGEIDDAEAAMHMYGMLLRTVVEGMMNVLMARASLKSEFRMPLTTIRPVENNPLKFSPTVDDALHNLFVVHGKGFLQPDAAIREGFEDIKRHQMAMMAGMQAGFQSLMETFHPDKFESSDKARRSSLMSVNKKSRAWDAYCEFYQNVTRDADSSFQTMFGESFASAYEDQIHRLGMLK